ncbi:MAG: WxL domain-containing protein [Lactobacillales bacterium]|jgi:hypothetical protein|nr:WxL domain-containing protein [Lactobacillales bacterium]
MKRLNFHLVLPILFLFFLGLNVAKVSGSCSELNGHATILYTGKIEDVITNPENPEEIVNPGESEKETGDLRIDYVPYFIFDKEKVIDKTLELIGHAQYYTSGQSPTGNFVQITDERVDATGWTLSVTQETEFTHASQKEKILKGTVLSIDNVWTNSLWLKSGTTGEPEINKEVIHIESGKSYVLATANENEGKGRWSIVFGNAGENPRTGSKQTVSPQFFEDKTPVLLKDSHQILGNYGFDTTKQQTYYNTAIQLSIPVQNETVETGLYETKLTWKLSATP